MHAVVIGGGIGGLATAIGLGGAGLDVTVLEQAEALRFGGFGLLVQPNGLRALDVIGAGDAVRAAGRPITRTDVAFASGRRGTGLELAPEAAPVAIERSRLLAALHERLAPHLGGQVALRTGARVTALEVDAERVRVGLADGGSLEADLLIGADGLHSVVRAHLHGDQPLRYAGYTVWRGLARGPGLAVDALREHWGRGKRFGIVPLADDTIYWFATANRPPGGEDTPDTPTALRTVFAGWPARVQDVIAATAADEAMRLDCYDRPPLRVWGRGPVTLLGDAAHPMTPNLGQGACQALEDAAALTLCFSPPHGLGDPEAALRAYERFRIPRARWFVERSWRFGRLGQRSNRVVCALRDAAIAHTPRRVMERAMLKTWSVSFDGLRGPTPPDADRPT